MSLGRHGDLWRATDGQDDSSPFAPGIGDRNRLVGLTAAGDAFTFAEYAVSESEFAGACWSADGSILFFNVFGADTPGSGCTLAVRGPWERGGLQAATAASGGSSPWPGPPCPSPWPWSP